MDTRTPIPVSVNPSSHQINEISETTRRSEFGGFPDKMSQRMRQFEEECKQWRDRFFRDSNQQRTIGLTERPTMSLDFPEFPSSDFGGFGSTRSSTSGGTSYKTFVEENYDGTKRYKIQFDIDGYKPNEISVQTDGRMLMVKGEKRIVQGNTSESKQFNRELSLPDFVDNRFVSSYQMADGSLVVEAPVIMEKFRAIGGGGGNQFARITSGGSSPYDERVRWSADRGRSAEFTNLVATSPLQHHQYSIPTKTIYTTTHQPTNRPIYSGQQQSKFEFDLKHYKPENISIKIDDNNVMTIHALRSDQDNAGKTYREFRREIELPRDLETSAIRSCFSSDGILSIELPENSVVAQPRHSVATTTTTIEPRSRNEPLKLTYDLKGYLPTEVSVRVNNNVLEVKAKKNAESAHSATHHSYQNQNTMSESSQQSRDSVSAEYLRKYRLPDSVNVEQLKAHLDSDGILSVEVPPRA